jgi:hypothetical protein
MKNSEIKLNYSAARKAATTNTYGGFVGTDDGENWKEVFSYDEAKIVIHVNFNGTFCSPHINNTL